MKLLLLLIFFSLGLAAQDFVLLQENIKDQTLNLQGKPGFNGLNGENGRVLKCTNQRLNGLDGEDGHDGEDGLAGSDLYIYTDDYQILKNLKVNQTGGVGGKPGRGGQGSLGCFGGVRGLDGEPGKPGLMGDLGRTYILPRNFVLPEIQKAKITTLKEFQFNPVTLGRHYWHQIFGLQDLLHPNSTTSKYYFTYAQTRKYKITLDWLSTHDISDVGDTKIAFKLTKDEFDLTSYQGALLDYEIIETHDGFIIAVHNIVGSSRFNNLNLKKIRGEGLALELEIKEKNASFSELDSRFVVAFKKYNQYGVEEDNTRFYEVPAKFIRYEKGSFFLAIGRMRIPDEFKQKGTKLKIFVTVYRKFRGQTRAFGLDGTFKI